MDSANRGEMDSPSPPNASSLLDLERAQLRSMLGEWGEPTYRAEQIWGWLYKRFEPDVQGMANLPAGLRGRLAQHMRVTPLSLVTGLTSRDHQTEKCLFELPDGARIESVLMHYERRHTVCVSTQVGCAVRCPFCATGQGGFVRDMSVGEIVAQVMHFAHAVSKRNQHISNVVFMGMGEPLLNYDATLSAVRRLNDARGFGLRARAMTISTVGVVPGIRRLSQEREQIGLAISLHAPHNELRDRLVPMNRRYPLEVLIEACQLYVAATGRRITFEYALMDGINDDIETARQLAHLIGSLLAQVNLIRLNPTPASEYQPSPAGRVRAFQDELKSRGVEATVRLRRGLEINAGCGQLRSAHANT